MLSQLKLSAALRKTVENELIPGEYIRWIGQPVPRFFTGASIGSVIFAIPWTSFALFWTWGALGFKLPDLREGLRPEYLFAMFGIPFILIGLAMLSSPLWVWQAARKTVYLITDKRAIIIQGGWSTIIRSYAPDQLNDTYRQERRNNIGDVIITVRRWKDSDGDSRSEEIGFLEIRNPREAEALLKQLARSAPSV
ncbi:MAG TPA: hypothetical protein V6C88_08615 [Chroococcidiopsis sp.]